MSAGSIRRSEANVVAPGTFAQAFEWSSFTFSAGRGNLPTLSWALYDSNNKVVDSFSFAANANNAAGGSWVFGPISLAAGTYYADIITNGALSAIGAKYTISAVPVPGPEAGAGLGALAMGAMALYIKRRRADEKLAA